MNPYYEPPSLGSSLYQVPTTETHGPPLAAKAAYFVRETRSSNAPQDEE
jgi:hypothetical protein